MATTIQISLQVQSPEMQDGLQARIHDPLWLLARQWQFGEFQGEDTGSPAAATLVVETGEIGRYRPGPSVPTPGHQAYSPQTVALETLVEREAVTSGAPGWRRAAEAGLHLVRLLKAEAVEASRQLFLASPYVFALPTPQQRRALDGASQRFLDVVGGRVVDGARLHTRLASLRQRNALQEFFREAPFQDVSPPDRPKVIRALTNWLAWYAARFSETEGPSAWVPERIEYEFAVSGNTAEGEVVLAAPEYLEGHLDWYSFVARPGTSLGATGSASTITTAFLPSPVSYRGMPSARLWEFEEATVNFAKVEANPRDLARLLLVKFALEYGNDWFVVPVELNVGVLCQIRSLIVTNTFGERLLIPHASEVDGDTSPWQMFAISEDSRHVFVLPPVLGPSLQSAPIEDVLFLRDEMANVAWAVERVVESPAGRPLDRFEAFQESRRGKEREEDSAPAGRPDGTIAYRLGTSVPDYWIPLLPVRHGTSIRLKRGVLPQSGAEGAAVISKPQGKVLEPDRDLLLHDEEVPREGARVTRSFQYARWIDGSTHLWIGRRKQPGRGEGSSGLQFDVAAHGALHDSNVRPPGS
jgi:hypothetical protein